MRRVILMAAVVWLTLARGQAQQPFVIDDAHVADYHHFHFETNNEFDFLPPESYPGLRQDTQTVKFSVGAFRHVEIGMDFPVINIFNSKTAWQGDPIGLGDADFSIKTVFREEKKGSKWPGIGASLNIEPPTGNPRKGLGSGLTDYYLNGMLQKSLSEKNILRMNLGVTFAGNTLTGDVGIRTRGTVYTGGFSLVRQFTPKFDLGGEIATGYSPKVAITRNQLQGQIGGNYEVAKNLTFDFGVIVGRFAGSPRVGIQMGFSKDF